MADSLDTLIKTDAAELIRKLEEATEGNWELDFEIQQQVEGWRNLGGGWREILATGKREQWNYTRSSPAYSTSLDAALTLIPEGTVWCLETNSTDVFDCVITSPHMDRDHYQWSCAPTPALALCIAALKARSAQ